jgi:hypothetical protein
MFGNYYGNHEYAEREYTTSSMIPVISHVPQWKEKGRIEQGLFGSKDELEQRITDEFLVEMAREAKEEREKIEAQEKKLEEERKKRFLKDKWQKILDSLSKNYKGINIEAQVLHPEVSAEVKRCMLIPSEFLRTRLVTECKQCSSCVWQTQEHYKPLRDPHDEKLDFDGHFPEDHVQLKNFEEKKEKETKKLKVSFQD